MLFGRQAEISLIRTNLVLLKTIIVLEGIGGVGKSAIAEEIYNEQSGSIEPSLWISAKGRPHLDCNEILDEIALRLDFPYFTQLSLLRKLRALSIY